MSWKWEIHPIFLKNNDIVAITYTFQPCYFLDARHTEIAALYTHIYTYKRGFIWFSLIRYICMCNRGERWAGISVCLAAKKPIEPKSINIIKFGAVIYLFLEILVEFADISSFQKSIDSLFTAHTNLSLTMNNDKFWS